MNLGVLFVKTCYDLRKSNINLSNAVTLVFKFPVAPAYERKTVRRNFDTSSHNQSRTADSNVMSLYSSLQLERTREEKEPEIPRL